MRSLVRRAIVDASAYRRWTPIALHLRTTHLHAVVDAADPVSKVVNTWKAYSTRALRTAGLVTSERKIWAHSANSTWLKGDVALTRAIRYVLDGQGDHMEVYVEPRP